MVFCAFNLAFFYDINKGYWWHILTKNLWVSELLLYLVTSKKFVCSVSSIEIVYLKSMYMMNTGIWILTVIPRVFQTNLHETNNTYNTLSTNLNTHIWCRSVKIVYLSAKNSCLNKVFKELFLNHLLIYMFYITKNNNKTS